MASWNMMDMTTILYLTVTEIMIVTEVLVTRLCIRHEVLMMQWNVQFLSKNVCQLTTHLVTEL